ncbi:SDR family NAD(P)-dependent oxidoreductase [Paenibacillus mucilaginosus]|uniref:Putative polyketide synthase n=1 Tax=Paenibacillus mucilaginosus (strain KNP414) TaxID=1036673 RepID=F8FQZ6_PAEMK|nr:SDR family NAD(P)-dependent oxidoreductase [Paenibacillus mucilaginosus]AEI40434.1 putative polyketide synthase [Paenibacillus mucilaginosus KNP414]MCG7213221.1 SDR family NAD(P)-dependent oxidoreductase [Paenibacillus mucilaginosus]WDM29613.1 SDR family NAD(P)-dependent oxidoreductase [Paenibacillus mucilaginosus]
MIHETFYLSDNNPFVANHRVHGQQLLPGLAYIDILFQVFRKHGFDYKTLELRHLSIYQPLIVPPASSLKLSVRCSETSTDSWDIRVEGEQRHTEGTEPAVPLYVTAQMLRTAPAEYKEQRLDLQEIRQTALTRHDLSEAYRQYHTQGLVHTGWMQAEGQIYETGSDLLIDISLGRDARPSEPQFMFHPVLIDGSGVGSGRLFAPPAEEEPRLFLPLFYESFRAVELLQGDCLTRIRKSSVLRKKELIYWTMEFFNRGGIKIAELTRFAGKLVREAGLLQPDRGPDKVLRIGEGQEPAAEPRGEGTAGVKSFLQELMAERLGRHPSELEPSAGYFELGLDSPGLLGMVKALEERIGIPLSPTLLFEHSTINELADYLLENHAAAFVQEEIKVPGSRPIPDSNRGSSGPPASTYLAGNEEIAIIGMAGRYPKAGSLDEFWKNLLEGKDCITEIPGYRWSRERMKGLTSPSGKPMSVWGGVIDDADCFDPKFFRISPREAETMDPQERLFLEVCWEAIEDAGYTTKTLVRPRGISGRRDVGVFAGVMHKDYTLVGAEALSQGQAVPLSLHTGPIANRVSYACNFHGPSMTVDTLCSSSLTAIHLAVESIRRGESEAALAGGVNLSLHPAKYITYGLWGMHSSDGRCRTFGSGGDGYVSSEGVAAVLLKPLSRAVADGDRIYALIKAATINHGGAASGILVPGPAAQGAVIADCLERAGVDPQTIGYIEAHGTGTSLGDPIEIEGLSQAFGSRTGDKQFCAIGSVKSNIGHAESAAGVIGLQKAALQLYHKKLVPSLHSEELNPYIDFKNSPFYVQRTTEEWKKPVMTAGGRQAGIPRRAGLSSFGATGSNAHLILEEYNEESLPRRSPTQGGNLKERTVIVPLSARNPERLKAYAEKMLRHLDNACPLTAHLAEERDNADTNTRRLLMMRLRSLLAALIHVDEEALDFGGDWSDYGAEPVHVRELAEKIQEAYGVELEPGVWVHWSSVEDAAEYLWSQHREILQGSAAPLTGTGDELLPGEESPGMALEDLAYTLQVGREAMDARVAFVACSTEELILKMSAFLEGEDSGHGWFQGNAKQYKAAAESLAKTDAELPETQGMTVKRLESLAQQWTQGADVNWQLLYGAEKPRRISLPTYPFAKERYWIPGHGVYSSGTASSPAAAGDQLHPLLHRNRSTFREQRFTSTFTGEEFFLADHVIQGRRILPGVACLEMARASLEESEGGQTTEENRVLRLKQVVWLRPFSITEGMAALQIRLKPEERGALAYELSSMPADEGEPELFSKGRAERVLGSGRPQRLDLEAIRSQFGDGTVPADSLYTAFQAMDMNYGPGQRGVEEIYTASNQVLAKLSLPSCVASTLEDYVLHPSLMDSALQATLLLQPREGRAPSQPVMPFALQEMDIHGGCTSRMWAWIRMSEREGQGDDASRGGKSVKYDIDLCDEGGRICVSMRGFTLRSPAGEPSAGSGAYDRPASTVQPPSGNLILQPVWEPVTPGAGSRFPRSEDSVLIIGGTGRQLESLQAIYSGSAPLSIQPADSMEALTRRLNALGRIDHIVWIAPAGTSLTAADERMIEEQESGVIACFRLIQALLAAGYAAQSLGWTLVTFQTLPVHRTDPVHPTHAGLHGLLGSMAKEFPQWSIRIADLGDNGEWPLGDILTLPADHRGHPWAYRGGEWYRHQLIPVRSPDEDWTATRYREGGVYVVIGGAGGVGKAWSEYMIRTYRAQIIWLGRRKADAGIRSELERLSRMGPKPHYIAADAADPAALENAYRIIKQDYGRIHGIVHSAMVLTDIPLTELDEDRFRAGLSAKVDTSVRMAQVFHEEPLDFVLYFSSLISFIKNPGQSPYASGCTFKDAFAHRLAREWTCPVKVMNWGYWSSEEAAASASVQQLARIGIGLIEPPAGMKALETLLAGPLNQLAMLHTTKPLPLEGLNPNDRLDIRPGTDSFPLPGILNRLTDQGHVLRRIQESTSTGHGLQDLLCRMVLSELWTMGMGRSQSSEIEELRAAAGIQDKYGSWLAESIRVLAGSGFLQVREEGPVISQGRPGQPEDLWEEWERKSPLWLSDASLRPWVRLVESTLRCLPDILSGRKPATDIMFPNSSMERVEGIYKNNPVADYFNEVLAELLLAYLEERIKGNPETAIRIIEIGAGTGGTSSLLFEKLRPYRAHIQEYCYTDISKAFLHHAERTYGPDHPYLTYKLYNVEEPFTGSQGPTGVFDVAVATNVLHATRNIRRTIRHAKSLLKPAGMLLINELSDNRLLTHLTFGLLEGWWLAEDQALRIPGSPGLYPKDWQRVLGSEGFGPVLFPAQAAHDWGQQIIAAASDGVIRTTVKAGREEDAVKSKGTLPQVPRTAVSPTAMPKSNTVREAVRGEAELTGGLLEELVRKTILDKLSEALKVDAREIDDEESFSDYGLDSIIGVNLVQVLNQAMDIDLDTTSLFDYSTVARLSAYILAEHREPAAQALARQQAAPEAGQAALMNRAASRTAAEPERPGTRADAEGPAEAPLPSSAAPSAKEPIAIIGMSGRFAGSDSLRELWQHLAQGAELIGPSPRWDLSAYYPEGSSYCDRGGFVEDIDRFDPSFFHINALEASFMDPQQRLFMEESWKALEDAGYTGDRLKDRQCGVYVGCLGGGSDYARLAGEQAPPQSFWGNAGSVIPARIAYYLDLQGPAVAVDTACSSSLVAVHLACQGLWAGEMGMALAGGVFVQSTPWYYLSTNKAGMLSPTGHSYTFDERADGFIPGEGIGVLVLKRLSDAERDGDLIHGVIRGSGINQDGTTNGITAPSAASQERLVCSVYDTFGIHPDSIQVVEAHGTGTKLGDPIEYQAISRAFRRYTVRKKYCAIGSIKTNIGHAAHAAGVAGILKILLAMKHKLIPPSLHFKNGNPNIPFDGSPFFVNTELRPWETEAHERMRAVVSSFGFSGTNAHIVLEEAPARVGTHAGKPGYPMVLSARTPEQLRSLALQWMDYAQENREADCADVSYTLLLGRKQFSCRLACVVSGLSEFSLLLKQWLSHGRTPQLFVSERPDPDRREQLSLRRYGNQCILESQKTESASEYFELLSTAAELFVQGYSLDYGPLFADGQYHIVSLPTYPFADERYWVPVEKNEADAVHSQIPAERPAVLHPLLHRNTSDLTGLRYSSMFSRDGLRLVPRSVRNSRGAGALAMLEMARAALLHAGGAFAEAGAIRLRHVVWGSLQGLGVEELTLHIEILPEPDGTVSYEIYSGSPPGGEAVVFSQGRASADIITAERLDLAGLLSQCERAALGSLEGEYPDIGELYAGREQVLAKVRFPGSREKAKQDWGLSPSVAGPVLQVSACLLTAGRLPEAGQPEVLPFSLEEVEVSGASVPEGWVLIRYKGAGDSLHEFDLDFCDEEGLVYLRLRGLAVRMTQPQGLSVQQPSIPLGEVTV